MSDFCVDALDTPAVVVDLDIAEANIRRVQADCNAKGIRNIPHFKTHKSIRFAQMQLDAGAGGMCCQKIGEAEVLVKAGVADIMISYNIIGSAKAEKLRSLAQKARLTLVCDNHHVADFLSGCFADSKEPVSVMVECDTGQKRSGVVLPKQASDLALYISKLPGIRFAGLMFYPPPTAIDETVRFLDETRKQCDEYGIKIDRVSSGGTPGLSQLGAIGETEYRAGTYIFNDRMMVAMRAASEQDCALTIYTTLVSNAEPGRGIVDAGSKTLSSDLTLFKDFAYLPDYPEARIYKLAEEHGFLDFSACSRSPQIGDILRIVPNHVCPVVNLCDEIPLVRGGELAGTLTIDARGKTR